MKNLLFVMLLLSFNLSFSQLNKIDKKLQIPRNIDFKGCVKNITINDIVFNKKEDKTDTLKTISQTAFSSKGKIETIKFYDKTLDNVAKIIELEPLGRIKTISNKSGNTFVIFANQYFSTKTEFPDSTFINRGADYKEKYINHFKNNLVIKQEHFVNDSLVDYRLYKYNKQNQLIEELYLNPENISGESVVFKAENKISIYPERQILYEYNKVKDTLFTIKIHPKYKDKQVVKQIKKSGYNLEITDEYENNFFKRSRFLYTSKDSISDISYYYNNKKEIRDYYKTFSTPQSITSKWKTDGYSDNQERNTFTKIDIIYDKHHNWIKKTYSEKNIISYIIERKIEYYCF